MSVASGFPITNGYTINIVRSPRGAKRGQCVVKTSPDQGTQTFLLQYNDDKETVEEVLNEGQEVVEEVFEDGLVASDDFFVGDIAHEELVYDTTEVVAEEVVDCAQQQEQVFRDESNVGGPASEAREGVLDEGQGVLCDICQLKLKNSKAAVEHMQSMHGVLTYQGPLFQCDFCLLLVTDRVSHMKKTHYLPLERGFTRDGSCYTCLSCSYTSDQLTNIRNHVDAKHTVSDKRYTCAQCSTAYRTLNSLRAHKSRVHGKRRKLEMRQEEMNKKRLTNTAGIK